MEHAAVPLKNLVVFLVAAGIILPLFHRARIGAVLGFLLIGVVVGPHGLGRYVESHPWLHWVTIADEGMGAFLAELGVVFLLFLVGLELSIRRLWSLRRLVLGVGGLQFAFSAAAIGACAALAGVSAAGSIVLGLCLAMSSTAIVMQLLEEQGRVASQVGRVAISVLLFQDLMVAPVLFGTQALSRDGAIAVELGTALLQAAAVVAAIVGAGRYLLRPLLRLAAQTGSREILIAITMLIVIAASWLTGHFGLSTALGAFLAGLLIAETEFSHQVEVDLAPLKGLLLGVFFMTVGMAIDIHTAWQQVHVIIAAVAVLLVIKALVLYGAARALSAPKSVAGELAILLPQGGEFAFVVIGLAAFSKVIEPNVAQIAAVVVGLSMLVTPLCAMMGRRIGVRLRNNEMSRPMPGDSEAELADHVVIGGFGRVGQTMARLLDAENVPYVAFDTDGELVSKLRKTTPRVFLGDAGRAEFLARLGGGRASAFVVTVNEPKAAERMVRAARKINPDAPVLARAVDPAHAAGLLRLGAIEVIPEAVEASLQLGAHVLTALGLPEDAVEHRIDRARAEELGRLTAELDGKR